jgi:hypothetical protein
MESRNFDQVTNPMEALRLAYYIRDEIEFIIGISRTMIRDLNEPEGIERDNAIERIEFHVNESRTMLMNINNILNWLKSSMEM